MYHFYAWLHWSNKKVVFEILLDECPTEPTEGRFLRLRRWIWRQRHKYQRCVHLYTPGTYDLHSSVGPYFPIGDMECTDRGAILRNKVEDKDARISMIQARYDFLCREDKRGKRYKKWRDRVKIKAPGADQKG